MYANVGVGVGGGVIVAVREGTSVLDIDSCEEGDGVGGGVMVRVVDDCCVGECVDETEAYCADSVSDLESDAEISLVCEFSDNVVVTVWDKYETVG